MERLHKFCRERWPPARRYHARLGAPPTVGRGGAMRVLDFILVVLVSMLALAAGGAPGAVANLPSETDGLIAFQRNDDAHGQIWLIDPSRNAPAVNLTSGTAPEARPAWGP